jgi:signal transduction histidine kinase
MFLGAIPFLLSSCIYLILGLWIVTRHSSKAQFLYGMLCLATFFWQAIWVALLCRVNNDLMLRIAYSGIVAIPPLFYHFILEFSSLKSSKWWLHGFYAMAALFAVLIWTGQYFVAGFYEYRWGFAAKAGIFHPIFLAVVSVVIVRLVVCLLALIRDDSVPLIKKQQAGLMFAALCLYSAAAFDVLSNYGIDVFPFSGFFTGIAAFVFSYAIFRYELLSIAVTQESTAERSRRLAASAELSGLGMTTAFPLVSQGELLGYLLLGEKRSEEIYNPEDLLLLRIIANQAALAYQRVRYLEMAVRGARTEMLGEIAGGFAHEIKTPLANISLPAELCFIDLTDVEQGKRKFDEVLPELKQRMKDIMQQTFRASDKIEAIRQFSKPGQVHMEAVDIGKIIQNGISLLDHLLRKQNIRLSVEISPSIPQIRASAKQLEIVFVNLIKNATEAIVSVGKPSLARDLWVYAREEGKWVVVSVKDSGPGIRRTDIGHLFEAYFTTKGSSGTGMGLFLSHQVIKAHGGSIEVQSEEGKGTEFIVRLPKTAGEARNASVHEAA